MPNWCDNTVEITGPKEILEKLLEEAKKNNLLNYLRPQPDYTVTPVAKTFPEISAKYAKTEEEREKALKNEPTIRKDAWWDWCVQNWGTKWELTFEGEYAQGAASLSDDGDVLYLNFASAWSPPVEAFDYWTQQNKGKGIRVEMFFYEGGCDFVGNAEMDTDEDVRELVEYNCSDLDDEFFQKDPMGKVYNEYFGILDWREICREDEEEWEKQQKEKEAANA